jgi:hypothetical protein
MLALRFRLLGGWSLATLLSLLSVSCSSSGLNPVRGKVTYKNQPLVGALVTFHPKGKADTTTVPSTGLTKEDGTFVLVTGDREGAPAGDYVITVICSEQLPSKPGAISTGPPETRDKLNGAYADRDKSTITVTVKAGENQIDPFDLK